MKTFTGSENIYRHFHVKENLKLDAYLLMENIIMCHLINNQVLINDSENEGKKITEFENNNSNIDTK